MHKITERDLTLDDFSHEHLDGYGVNLLNSIIQEMNRARRFYTHYAEYTVKYGKCDVNKKDYWWQMIQLLPQSFNQRRTVQMNYAVLRNMYEYRKDHKLDEWQMFCKWIEELPYSRLITGESK